MIGPAVNPPRPGVAAFRTLVDEAMRHSVAARETSAHALGMGVFPDQIISYVRGEPTTAARAEMMQVLATCPWAMTRVVALVKARRDPSSLGARILATEGPVDPNAFGVPSTGDPDADLANLLDRV